MKRAELKTVPNSTHQGKQNFLSRDSLFRTVVFATIIISLFPVLVYGTFSYFRSRAHLQSLVSNQLANITSIGVKQIEDFVNGRKAALDKMVGEEAFSSLLSSIVQSGQNSPTDQDAQSLQAQQFLSGPAAGSSETLFDYLIILDQKDSVAVSSNAPWVRSVFASASPSSHPALSPLLAKGDTSAFLYAPFPPFKDQFVLLTVRHFKTSTLDGEYTILALSSAPLPAIVLKQAAGFFQGARAYYYFESTDLLLTSGEETSLIMLEKDPAVMATLSPALKDASLKQPLNYVSYNKTVVLAYVKKVPDLGLDLILEVPAQTLFGQIPILDVYYLLMVAFVVIALAGLAYLGTTRVVKPLQQLNKVAHGLADGNFSLRADIDREDEIGELADSMNRLGGKLTGLTSTLEGKVEQRTAQLSAASEIASLAASFTNLSEVAEKTVTLINERFNFYHTAIFLVDETGTGITLQDGSGEIGVKRKQHSRLILFVEGSLPGDAAQHNQARVVADLLEIDEDLPEARSQAAVPISTANKVLGVLEVFGRQVNDFDADMVFVLQSLANQIAAALKNASQLAPNHIDLEETDFLFTLTRQIIEAGNEKSISDLVLKALPQFPHTCAFLAVDQNNLNILGLFDPRSKKFEGFLSKIDIPATNYYDEIAAGIPIFVQDISQPNNYDNVLSFFLRRGCKSAVIVPSLQNGKVMRLLILGFHEDDHVSQSRLQPYFYLADVITTALGRTTALNMLQSRLSEMQILANFSKATSLESDVERLYQILHDQVARILGSDIGFLVAVQNHKTQQIDIPFAYENSTLISLNSIPMGQGLISYVIQHREPLLLVKDIETKAIELGAWIVGKPARSWMGIPLIVGSELIGVLVFQDHQRDERFTQADMELLLALAPQIGMVIRGAQLARDLQDTTRAFTQERQLIEAWLNNTEDMVIVKNTHGQYIRASQAIMQAFGINVEQLAGKSDFDLLTPEAAARSTEEELLILAERKPKFDILETTSVNGKDAWFMASKIPISGPNGESSGLLSIRRDVTAQKLAEQESNRRAEEILTSAEIAREATSRLNIDELLEKTIQLISERFGFYHVAIFLLDVTGELAVLREATGEVGRQMKADHFKLPVGSQSIVGQAIALAEPVIVNNVSQETTEAQFKPLLPETCAEMVLPLKIGDRILGVLDVHSTQAAAFGGEDIAILGILADQLAIAVNNAELFALTQKMLAKHHMLHQITVAASTSANLDEALAEVTHRLVAAQEADRAAIFLLRDDALVPAASDGYQETGKSAALAMGKVLSTIAVKQHKPVLVKDPRSSETGEITRSQTAMPILFGEEVLGVLNLESNQAGMFNENDQEIISALVNNIGAVIANWRLVNQIRRQVERQESLFTATAKIRRSIDIPTILQTSVVEIGRALGANAARITLAEDLDMNLPIEPAHLTSGSPLPGSNGKADSAAPKDAAE